jgi:hypothetical protein
MDTSGSFQKTLRQIGKIRKMQNVNSQFWPYRDENGLVAAALKVPTMAAIEYPQTPHQDGWQTA